MIQFERAAPKQAYLKASMYGGPGTGKTYTALLMAEGLAAHCGKRIALVDTEHGTDFYAKERPADPVHPKAFDFDGAYTRSLRDALQLVRGFDCEKYGVLIIDSISHLWQAAIEAYDGKRVGAKQDKIPVYAWNDIKAPYKELIDRCQALNAHTFIIGRQKNVWDVEGDEWTKVGVAMKAEGDTQYEPHLCLHMTLHREDDITTPILWAEKDRTSCIAGRSFPKPSFRTIEPILALLGAEQAGMEDDDARREQDAELLLEREDAQRKKQDKSGELFAELQAAIISADNVAEIGAAGQTVKKKLRSLTEEHRDALRAIYEERRKTLVAREAGDV